MVFFINVNYKTGFVKFLTPYSSLFNNLDIFYYICIAFCGCYYKLIGPINIFCAANANYIFRTFFIFMKLIPLYGKDGIGKFAQVDDEDYDFLMQWRWFYVYKKTSSNYYIVCNFNLGNSKWQVKIMHQLIIGKKEKLVIDHIDGNTLNNQKHNIRHCKNNENVLNKRKYKNGSSIFKGVTISEKKDKNWAKRWMSRIQVNNNSIYLGIFPYTKDGEIKAAKAYNDAAIKYHGEFSCLNDLTITKRKSIISVNKKIETKIPKFKGVLPLNSKAIYLSQGKFTIVDESNYDLLNQWSWAAKESTKGYFCAYRSASRIKGQKRPPGIRMHRFIMNCPKELEVDHINRNPLDNRRCNLRIVTSKQNAKNRSSTILQPDL